MNGRRSCRSVLVALAVSGVLHGGLIVLGDARFFAPVPGLGGRASAASLSVSMRITSGGAMASVGSSLENVRVPAPAVVHQETGPEPERRLDALPHKALPSVERSSVEDDAVPNATAALTAGDSPSVAGSVYYKPSELTRRPRPAGEVTLSYPVFLPPVDVGRGGGVVILRVLIAETGVVDQVFVEFSDLPEAFQDEAVLRFAHARFLPGEIDDLAVKSQMRVEVILHPAAQSPA